MKKLEYTEVFVDYHYLFKKESQIKEDLRKQFSNEVWFQDIIIGFSKESMKTYIKIFVKNNVKITNIPNLIDDVEILIVNEYGV